MSFKHRRGHHPQRALLLPRVRQLGLRDDEAEGNRNAAVGDEDDHEAALGHRVQDGDDQRDLGRSLRRQRRCFRDAGRVSDPGLLHDVTVRSGVAEGVLQQDGGIRGQR